MQRARSAFLAALGLVSVLALGACTSGNPRTAVVVSHTTISVSDVDSVVAEVKADARKADGRGVPEAQYGSVRERVAAMYAFTEVSKRYAKEKGYPAPQVDYAGVAQSWGLPESDRFARLDAESQAYERLLLSKAEPVQPAEADYRALYDELVASGLMPYPYQEIRESLTQIKGFPQALGVRSELTGAAKRYNVSVNPMYGSVDWPVLQLSDQSGRSVRTVPIHLGGQSGRPVVTPAAIPAAPQAAARQ